MYGWDEDDYNTANQQLLKQAGIEKDDRWRKNDQEGQIIVQSRAERVPSSERWQHKSLDDSEEEAKRPYNMKGNN